MSKSFFGGTSSPGADSSKTTGYFSNATAQASAAVSGHFKIQEKLVTGPVGPGVPSGGSDKSILMKVSGSDYDTEWTDNLDNITIDANMNGGYF